VPFAEAAVAVAYFGAGLTSVATTLHRAIGAFAAGLPPDAGAAEETSTAAAVAAASAAATWRRIPVRTRLIAVSP
jgi:hypothetical protein